MAGKKEPGISWHHTSVVVRADIFSKAHERGIDISNVCNKALADLLGVDYRQQQLEDMLVTRPVIIAENGHHAERTEQTQETHTEDHTPVINADDPAASTTVRSTKRQPKARPAPKETYPVTAQPRKKEVAVLSTAANAAKPMPWRGARTAHGTRHVQRR